MDEFTAAAATPINPSLIQPITDFQYIDANGNIVKGVPAFVSPDGRQIILKDIDPISGIGEAIVTPPQSFIVQHQVAPSSVSANSTLQRNASTSNAAATTVNGNSNGIRVTTSSTNLSTHQPQTQQQQQQQPTINNKLGASVESTSNVVNREETRRSSAASLTGG
jgi:hypothetical protein